MQVHQATIGFPNNNKSQASGPNCENWAPPGPALPTYIVGDKKIVQGNYNKVTMSLYQAKKVSGESCHPGTSGHHGRCHPGNHVSVLQASIAQNITFQEHTKHNTSQLN
jgi:hypothetical protein